MEALHESVKSVRSADKPLAVGPPFIASPRTQQAAPIEPSSLITHHSALAAPRCPTPPRCVECRHENNPGALRHGLCPDCLADPLIRLKYRTVELDANAAASAAPDPSDLSNPSDPQETMTMPAGKFLPVECPECHEQYDPRVLPKHMHKAHPEAAAKWLNKPKPIKHTALGDLGCTQVGCAATGFNAHGLSVHLARAHGIRGTSGNAKPAIPASPRPPVPTSSSSGVSAVSSLSTPSESSSSSSSLLSGSQAAIIAECDALKTLLLARNASYGNSALDPVRIFARTSDPVEQLNIQIDHKLSRLMRGEDAGEDVEQDLCGYLILRRIARQQKQEAAAKEKQS